MPIGYLVTIGGLMLRLLILTFLSVTVSAKLFPVPFSKQLSEADGIIYGVFLGEGSKKLPDGKIVTEASFKLNKTVGLENRYLVNKKLFKIQFDGGEWQGLRHQNRTAPQFIVNKAYVVLIKKGQYAFTPYMDRLGAYEVIYEVIDDQETLGVKSLAFPEHPKLGFIPYRTFDILVHSAYGSYMSETSANQFVYIPKKDIERTPGSIDEEESPVKKKGQMNALWFALILGLLGAYKMRKTRRS